MEAFANSRLPGFTELDIAQLCAPTSANCLFGRRHPCANPGGQLRTCPNHLCDHRSCAAMLTLRVSGRKLLDKVDERIAIAALLYTLCKEVKANLHAAKKWRTKRLFSSYVPELDFGWLAFAAARSGQENAQTAPNHCFLLALCTLGVGSRQTNSNRSALLFLSFFFTSRPQKWTGMLMRWSSGGRQQTLAATYKSHRRSPQPNPYRCCRPWPSLA